MVEVELVQEEVVGMKTFFDHNGRNNPRSASSRMKSLNSAP
jgi:hypothetical protein